MATGNWHIRTVYGPRRQGKLLIVCIWWDSDTKQWVVIECTLPHLLGWAQFTLFRDMGLHPEEYDLFTTILGQSATTPHDAIKEHQVYPEEHGWKHLKSRLHEVDIVFGIGCRALGYDVTTLANGFLKLMKPDSQIVLTRQKGRLPSYVTCPLDLIEEAGTARHALDFDDLDQTDQERARFFYDLNLRFLKSGDLGALLSDPDTSPARCVILECIQGYSARMMMSLGVRIGNASKEARRFPALPDAEVPDDGVQPKGAMPFKRQRILHTSKNTAVSESSTESGLPPSGRPPVVVWQEHTTAAPLQDPDTVGHQGVILL